MSGGSADDTFVIYQVTGGSAGEGAATVLNISVPNLYVTNNNTADVTVAYNLYETAGQAANQTAGTSLFSKAGTLFGFASGVKYTAAAYTNTVLVNNSYKKFATSASAPTTTVSKAEIGKVTFGVSGAFNASGVAGVLTDFIKSGTKIVFKGDFSAVGTTGAGATVGAAGTCAAVGTSTTSVSTDKQTVTWTSTANADLAAVSLCFDTDNSVTIPAQTFTYDVEPVAANSSVTVANPAAATIGTFKRDGTVLQAPFATIHPDYLSRIVLTSQHSVDVPYTLSAITESGVTCTAGAGATGTLKKGTVAVINVKDICTGTDTGATRLAIQAVIAAPLDSVHGLYNVMNYDVTTGKTNSLISYPMVRPTEN